MNIFVRTQTRDLCKYLSDNELVMLSEKVHSRSLDIGEYLFHDDEQNDYLIVIEEGELALEVHYPDKIMITAKVNAGELCNEDNFIIPNSVHYRFRALRKTQVNLLPFSSCESLMKMNVEIAAKLHAAFNDSLCMKITRLTQRINEHE